MKQANLLPTTSRMKQLIQAHGKVWNIVRESEHTICFDAKGIFIESVDGNHSRWVRPEHIQQLGV